MGLTLVTARASHPPILKQVSSDDLPYTQFSEDIRPHRTLALALLSSGVRDLLTVTPFDVLMRAAPKRAINAARWVFESSDEDLSCDVYFSFARACMLCPVEMQYIRGKCMQALVQAGIVWVGTLVGGKYMLTPEMRESIEAASGGVDRVTADIEQTTATEERMHKALGRFGVSAPVLMSKQAGLDRTALRVSKF